MLFRSRIYNLRIYSLRIYSLRIYNLRIYSLRICSLNNGRGLVHILVRGGIIVRNLGYRGIAVHNMGTRYTLASKISPKAAYIYRTNLVK